MLRRDTVFSALTPLRIGALLGIVFALLRFSGEPTIENVAARALDRRLFSRDVKQPGPEVVIVAVDDTSLDSIGRWPWSRTTMAQLIDRITDAGAAVIGLDLVQSEAAAGDEVFLDSVGKSKRTVLGYYFDFNQTDAASLATRISTYSLVWNSPSDPSQMTVHAGTSIRRNLPALTEAARGLGYFNFIPDADGSYRRVPLTVRVGDSFALPLSLAMLHVYRPQWNLGLRFRDSFVESVQLGPTTIPVAENGEMLINYRGPGKTFPHVSASAILSGTVAPDVLRDKLVLVGVTATAVADVRVAPFDSFMPGVEIHANVIDSILRNDFLWSATSRVTAIESILILILALALGLCLSFARGVYGFVAALAFAAAYDAGSQQLFLRTGICLSTVFPMLAIGLTYGGVSVQHFVAEERAKRQTRNALERYVPPAVARLVSNKPELLALGGETRELTVMFLDIRGFTTISERMRERPQELVALLNTFLDAMTVVIFDHGGTLDKYIGDEIMAFWGAPLPQADHAARACRCAVALLARLEELNGDFVKRGWPTLDIGIGINSGTMVVGNMGSSLRLSYSVVGDNVNLAARLEGLNKKYGTRIIASAATIESADVVVREVDVVRVKGKDQAVHVFEIVADKSDEHQWTALLQPFRLGLDHYRAQRWKEAAACFREVLAAKPGDAPAQLYLERIAALENNPPPADWDGVTVMDTK